MHAITSRAPATTCARALSALVAALLLLSPPPQAAAQSASVRKQFLPLVGQRLGATNAQPPTSAGPQRSIGLDVLRLVNVERVAAGCQVLRFDGLLTLAAERHSQDQALRDYVSVVAPDGLPLQVVEDGMVSVAYWGPGDQGELSVARVVEEWKNTSRARALMLDCTKEYGGVGVYSQPDDQPNVQAVDPRTGVRVPFGADDYSVDPGSGARLRGPYYYYTTFIVSIGPQ